MRVELPTGTVTFLFTDVEGSTLLLHSLGAEGYADALAGHRRLIREACAAEGGVEVDTQGDAFFFAFPTAPGALVAAAALTEALAAGPIQVRVGLHTGTPLVTEEGYVGDDVHFAARVAAAGHGGQVVLSAATAKVGLSGSEPQALPVRDLGEHRLKDIAEAVAIFQLGDGSFPPLKTISNTNLPRPASSFVGREAEVEAVLSRIEGGARLVTLTGPGGSGKTRLAIEAAASLVGEYKAGVFWVGLASLRDPALVSETIAQTLGAKDGLAAHIGERELLLLVDNLEQVIEAAPELSALLAACPNLTLLVTSRELLRVQGELEYAVPPLAEPEAVELFCARAQLEPSKEIAELCARLDSLPLAVELAAARTKALSPAQILKRLSGRLDLLKGGRDADPRQQTLRATIEWSYDLLTEEEQLLFARLSVFAGSCSLEAAEEVAGADLDALQSLVEKSLLRFSNERHWMLETIREYAHERLVAMGLAESTSRAHFEHFRQLAEDTEPRLGDSDQAVVLDQLEREHANFRAALNWALSTPSDDALELAVLLARFWRNRDHELEGYRWIEKALSNTPTPPLPLHANALLWAGGLALEIGEVSESMALLSRALERFRLLDDERGILSAQFTLGIATLHAGDAEAARQACDEVIQTNPEPGFKGRALLMRGEAERALGHPVQAAESFSAAIALAHGIGDRHLESAAIHSVGDVLLMQASYDEAATHYKRSLEVLRGLESLRLSGPAIGGLAATAAYAGDVGRAGELWGAFECFELEAGYEIAGESRALYERLVAPCEGLEFETARARGRGWSLAEAIEVAIRT